MATTVLLLDACSLLNFYGSGHFASILSLPYDFALAEKVKEEALYVYRGGDGEDTREKENIDIQEVLRSGLLGLVKCETVEEIALYVSLATQLDDGEAMTCALAICRGYSIVTDDRKAVGLMSRETPPISCLSSLAILKEWSEQFNISPIVLHNAFIKVKTRANYIPSKKHPLKSWWDEVLDSQNST